MYHHRFITIGRKKNLSRKLPTEKNCGEVSKCSSTRRESPIFQFESDEQSCSELVTMRDCENDTKSKQKLPRSIGERNVKDFFITAFNNVPYGVEEDKILLSDSRLNAVRLMKISPLI